jgi:hypothetical protein
MKRRGLSDVVTTVLIILLVLAAVAIIWGYLRGALEESGSQITGACLTLDLKPLSCVYKQGTSGYNATVRYGRDAGEAQLTNVTLIVEVAGENRVSYATRIPNALESYTTNVTNLNAAPSSFTVAGTVITEAGQAKQCPQASKVQCILG